MNAQPRFTRIVTVTPSPSLDRTVNVDRYRRGHVHRVAPAIVEPSGKGVNVAIALHVTGRPKVAVLPVGAGSTGRELTSMLDDMALPYHPVPITGGVRTNLSIIEADGTTTKFNEPGPPLTSQDVREIVDAAEQELHPGGWVAWCGSLPSGFGTDALAAAIAKTRASQGYVALDTSDAALAAVLAGPQAALPHLIKPNADELAELVRRRLPTITDVVAAARSLVDRGIDTVLVSLGGDGAVLADADGVLHGQASVPAVVNTAGAGDAFLAGYLAAPVNATRAEKLASALQFGAAAVQHRGTLLLTLGSTARTTINEVVTTRTA